MLILRYEAASLSLESCSRAVGVSLLPHCLVLWRPSVQTVVLSHEEEVEDHREQTQAELRRVSEYQPPLI